MSLENSWYVAYCNRQRRAALQKLFKEELDEVANRHYLSAEENDRLRQTHNKAVQLLDTQSQMVQQLYGDKTINMIQQIELQGVIGGFYHEQGKAERIKQTPFPRKHASFSFLFVCIFIFLLPFGIVGEFGKLGNTGVWLSIPVGVIVGWMYLVMEMIGDYTENPFEGLHNDAPMLAICRDIEIDMLEIMREERVPAPIQPKEGTLL